MDAMERLLEFARDTEFVDLPSRSVERTKRAVLDTLAVGLAGAKAAYLPELTSLVCDWGANRKQRC